MLAGHYDTVPAQENVPGRIEDGAVHGCGASDMKGGVAVALELVRELAGRDPGLVDVALLLFGREELPPAYDPLPALFDGCDAVRDADLAVLLEPTDLEIQAGCVGNLTVRVTFHGRSGHSARPWLADNALHRAIEGLARVAGHERREALVDGLPFFEVVSVTRLAGGVADNVVPGLCGGSPQPALPTRPHARGGRAGDPLARSDGCDGGGRRQLAAGRRLRRRTARPGAARHRRFPACTQAGMDERRRLHVPRDSRRELRARCDALRAHAGRAGRDLLPRRGLTRRFAGSRSDSVHACRSRRSCAPPPPTRSSG